MSEGMIMLTLTRIEVGHLVDLVRQFADLVNGTPSDDPAVERLTPEVYPNDPDASREFRSLTRGDLLHRRAHDAAVVRRALEGVGTSRDEAKDERDFEPVDIAITGEAVDSWLRTLAALRLVVASRLGIETDDDHEADDPRYGVYEWLGYRLDGLVQAVADLG